MNWKKVMFETDDKKLTFREFLAQATLVGVALIGGFYIATVLS